MTSFRIIILLFFLALTGCSLTVTPSSTGVLCPFSTRDTNRPPPPPPRTPSLNGFLAGDREFDGHGPNITVNVRACISIDRRTCVPTGDPGPHIIALIDFDAREADADGTSRGDGSWILQRFIHPIYSAPRGSAVVSIDSPTSSTIVARSAPAGPEAIQCNDGDVIDSSMITITGGLVRSITLIGDTGADDVSDDNNCHCDTRIDDIVFNNVTFTLDEDTEPTPDPPMPPDWQTGAWSLCEDNTRTRSVTCSDPEGECDEATRPASSEPCGPTCAGVLPRPDQGDGTVAMCFYDGTDTPVGCVQTRCSEDGNSLLIPLCARDAGGNFVIDFYYGYPCGGTRPDGSSTSCMNASGFARDGTTVINGKACR